MQTEKISDKRHRFPQDIIAHAVWLYVRSNLSLREVKEMLLEPGIDVSYETIRRWTDRQCVVLDEILQSKRATKRLLLRLIKCHRLPKREVVAGLNHWRTAPQQSRRVQPSAMSKAGTSDAKLPVTLRSTAVRFNSFRDPKLYCRANQTPRRPD